MLTNNTDRGIIYYVVKEVEKMKKLVLMLRCVMRGNYKWAMCHLFNKNIFQYYDKNIVDIIFK